MKTSLFGWLAALLILTFSVQGALAGEKVKFYQMNYQMENVKGVILINGFNIAEPDGKSGSGSAALNIWLIGDNELKAEVKKADPSKPALLSFGVSELEAGSMVDTTDKGKLFHIELKDKEFKTGQAAAAKKFKSSLNFKQHLSDAGEAKESDVLAYAQKYVALITKKDADGVMKETAIKISDYSLAFGGADMKAEFKNFLKDDLFKSKLNKIDPAKLKAIPMGPTKRIWLVKNGSDELIKSKSSGGSTSELPVYIGLIDGRLQVVR